MSLAIGESSRIASAPARNRRHVARIVSQAGAKLLAILDFARIVSALVVVVGVTSHLGSGAALSPRRRRIASVGAHTQSHRDATIARSAAHNPSTSRIESEAALNPSGLEKKFTARKHCCTWSTYARFSCW